MLLKKGSKIGGICYDSFTGGHRSQRPVTVIFVNMNALQYIYDPDTQPKLIYQKKQFCLQRRYASIKIDMMFSPQMICQNIYELQEAE